MSNLADHEAEQAAITAACEAGTCDHPECQDDFNWREAAAEYVLTDAMGHLGPRSVVAVALYDADAGEAGLFFLPGYEPVSCNPTDVVFKDILKDIRYDSEMAYNTACRVMPVKASKSAQQPTPIFVKDRTLAALLDTSRITIHRYVRSGILPAPIKIGGITRFDLDECLNHIRNRALKDVAT